MSEVPPDLYSDILSRLFVESLLRFRCVCKAWRRIIDDPAFIKLHLHRQSKAVHLIFCNDTSTEHYTASLDSLTSCYSSKAPTKAVVASPLKTPTHTPTLPISSCNGLILISDRVAGVEVLWNPFTREVHELPAGGTGQSHLFCELGYDSVTDDYKYVKIGKYDFPIAIDYRRETLVYSLKSNLWKRVKDYPHYLPWPLGHVVCVNGALHWISAMSGNNDEPMIVAFDLATEDYYTLPLPSEPFTPRWPAPEILNALGEYLLVTWKDSVYRLDDYGGKNMWTKLFSFSGGMGLRNIRPIAYFKSKGEFFLRANADEYFRFDIKKKSAKKVSIGGAQEGWYSQICLPSLVRLSNSGGGAGKGTSAGKRKRPTNTDRYLKKNKKGTGPDVREVTNTDEFQVHL